MITPFFKGKKEGEGRSGSIERIKACRLSLVLFSREARREKEGEGKKRKKGCESSPANSVETPNAL